MILDYPSGVAPRTHQKEKPMLDTDEFVTDDLDDTNLRVLEAVFHEAALIASEDITPSTAEEIMDEAALALFMERLTRG